MEGSYFYFGFSVHGFYYVDRTQSIYYDDDDLVIKLLFESLERCRQFYGELFSIYYRFSMVMPLEVVDSIQLTTLIYQPKPLLPNDYDTTEFDSPMHSMNASDYALKSIGGSHEENLSVCTVSDPHSRLQMIENPDHPFLRGLKLYRCHLESQASNKKQKSNQNNILHMSWQRFDGLNLVGDKHMVPSIAFQFIKSAKETVEVVEYPSFEAMIGEGLNNVLPGIDSVEQGRAIYYQFYSPEEESKLGVIALRLN
jgi:serine/threonine protein kinase